jgi:ubiquinone/menaquinone biosynthesis C-methylase UbiE
MHAVQSISAVYASIAHEFDHTRYKPWPSVVKFIESFHCGRVLDIGCGNGKYIPIVRKQCPECVIHACDMCDEFVDIIQKRYPYAIATKANCCALPYDDNSIDYIISIAMFHHLRTDGNRIQCLDEMRRVLKPGGIGLITVWSTDAYKSTWKRLVGSGSSDTLQDVLVPWKQKNGVIQERYYHLFTQKEIHDYIVSYFTILDIWFECDNWYVQFEKVSS